MENFWNIFFQTQNTYSNIIGEETNNNKITVLHENGIRETPIQEFYAGQKIFITGNFIFDFTLILQTFIMC